ncbi:hypothetical protein B0H19DRAFT_1371122 [Mycena capillaripes]|nr:hypothetical protein B0H19DRAFT_1371122 [Mycena capillaripes]
MSFPREQDRFLAQQEHHGALSPVRPNIKEASEIPPVDHISTPRGIGFWTPLCIVGGTLAAALVAILHYVFDSHLNNHSVSGYWTQTKSSQIEILLANAYKIFFCFSAGVSLVQVSWRTMRRQPLPLADINALMGSPSMLTLPRVNLIFQAPITLAIIIAILASPLITVFAPSLSVRRADAVTRTLTVPTLDLTTDRVLDDFTERRGHYGPVSDTWDTAAVIALLAESPVGWPMPEGCAPECQYNITYAAPAILCTDLESDQIDDGAADGRRAVSRVFQDPPAAYLIGYDTLSTGQKTALNFTTLDRFQGFDGGADPDVTTDQYVWTLAFVPFLASNENDGALINAAGSVCVFYQATHEAQTHFFNGTQETTVSVLEYQEALNTTFKSNPYLLYSENGDPNGAALGVPGVSYAPGIGAHVHPLAMVDAMNGVLAGFVDRDINTGVLSKTQTRITETNLFQPIDTFYSGLLFPGLNMSTSVTNISTAFQQLIANTTLGFIHFATGNTTVEAAVPSAENVYVFNHTTLGATYLVSFGILLLITIAGMVALFVNGEPKANNFSSFLAATRNPNLHPVTEAIKVDPDLKREAARARLVFGEVVMPNGRVEPGFGVADADSMETLKRRR